MLRVYRYYRVLQGKAREGCDGSASLPTDNHEVFGTYEVFGRGKIADEVSALLLIDRDR